MPSVFLFIFLTSTGLSSTIELYNSAYKVTWDIERGLPIKTNHILYFDEKPQQFKRPKFIPDSRIKPRIHPKGYDRGHMVPAGDMRWNEKIYKETFLFSNLSPQVPELNRGTWFELEKKIRRKLRENNHFEITTGAIFTEEPIPIAFYKIIYNPISNQSISYLLPNNICNLPLQSYQIPLSKLIKIASLDEYPPIESDNKYLFSPAAWRLPFFIFLSLIIIFIRQSIKIKQY
ncbi:MAG: DNA/RNA non-specific endonuclease [Lentisphaeria bacterium]